MKFDVGEVASGAGHVLGGRVAAPPAEALVGADRLYARARRAFSMKAWPTWGRLRIGVVEPPGVAGIAEGVGEVREHLPGGDRVAARVLLHLVEVRLERPVVRQRLGVEENRVPAADELGRVARLLHDRRRQRAPLGRDRERRQGDHVRVAPEEELLEEHLAREAGAGVVLAAVHLREHLRRRTARPRVDGIRSYSRWWPWTSKMNSSPAECLASRVLVLARLRPGRCSRRPSPSRRSRPGSPGGPAAWWPRPQAVNRNSRRDMPSPRAFVLAGQVRPADRLALDRRQRRGDELPVRARPELDRKAWILGGSPTPRVRAGGDARSTRVYHCVVRERARGLGAALLVAAGLSAGIVASGAMAQGPAPALIAFSSGGRIFTIEADGSNREQLTGRCQTAVGSRRLLPRLLSRRRQARVRPRHPATERCSLTAAIYLMDADGTNRSRLTGRRRASSSPSIRSGPRDRQSLAVFSRFRVESSAIVVIRERRQRPMTPWCKRRFTARPFVYLSEPAWDPDGSRLAYTKTTFDREAVIRPSLHLIDRDGTNRTLLARNAGAAAWSPDGARIAFASTKDENGTDCYESCVIKPELYVMDADGTNLVRLTRNKGYDSTPDWSADGQHLVFASDRNFPAAATTALELYSIAARRFLPHLADQRLTGQLRPRLAARPAGGHRPAGVRRRAPPAPRRGARAPGSARGALQAPLARQAIPLDAPHRGGRKLQRRRVRVRRLRALRPSRVRARRSTCGSAGCAARALVAFRLPLRVRKRRGALVSFAEPTPRVDGELRRGAGGDRPRRRASTRATSSDGRR